MNLTAIPPKIRAALYWCGYVIGVLGQGLTIVWGAVAASSPDISMPTWLVIASAVLGLVQTQLNLLAGSNVHASAEPPARGEDGRFRPLPALVLAFLMAIAGVLLMLTASPAQAAGWSGVRCDNQVQSNASKVCVDVHTIPSGNGLRVDQVEVCAFKVPGPYANGLRATFNNAIYFRGGAGAWIDGKVLEDTGASQGGSCSYTNMVVQLGKSACYVAGGTMDIPGWTDSNWSVSGGITGGAWDCP